MALSSRLALLALLCLIGCSAEPDPDSGADALPPDPFLAADVAAPLTTRVVTPRFGDLEQMRARGFVRVLVSGGPSAFTIDRGRPRGFEVEMLEAWVKELNAGRGRGEEPISVVFVPLRFASVLSALREGRGDIVAAGLTITPERQAQVGFTDPYIRDVNEIVVAHAGAPRLESLDDLAGRTVHVARGTSYVTHLREVSDRLEQAGLDPIDIALVDERLSSEDVLELVSSGAFQLSIADSHLALLLARALEGLRPRPELILHGGGAIAWAVRTESRALRRSLNAFVARSRKGTLLGNILFRRYFENERWARNPLSADDRRRLARFEEIFRKYAKRFGFDWLQIAAQAFQESGLDPEQISPRGATGLMQVLPSTAADPSVGILEVGDPEANVHAGVKYMAFLRDRYFSEPEIAPEARFDLTLAAYNMGPGRLSSLRRATAERGLDPNLWFDNVEQLALEQVGQEPVRYVVNVNKYYVAYRWALGERRQAEEQKRRAETG